MPLGVAKGVMNWPKVLTKRLSTILTLGSCAVMVQSWCSHGAVHTGVVALALQLEASAES